MEFEEYKKEIEEKFGSCQILNVKLGTDLKNSEGTSDRIAYKNVPWIYYWRAMTGLHSGTMKCSSCGKGVFTGVASLAQRLTYGVRINEYIAVGGHVWVETPASKNYKGGWYITPLCPACNAKRGKHIPIMADSVLCKELGANQ